MKTQLLLQAGCTLCTEGLVQTTLPYLKLPTKMGPFWVIGPHAGEGLRLL